MALATATFAQTNTSTVNQLTGENNTATITQAGNLNTATVEQIDATTKNNFATINQLSGKSNVATIMEKGTGNRAIITQSGLQTPASSHKATINISNAASKDNLVSITQAGEGMEADIALSGSNSAIPKSITIGQSGTTNKAKLVANVGLNDFNSVAITQAGLNNQSYTAITGNSNTVTVGQAGTSNTIGTFAGGGNVALTLAIASSPMPNPCFLWMPISGAVNAGPGISITGNTNIVTVNQGAATVTNQVGVLINGANNNIVTINQLGTATNNKAAVQVLPGQSGNQATIDQLGTATGNEAGIYQEGSNAIAQITQTGNNNKGIVYQQVGTTIGTNNATLKQSGNGNTGWISQGGLNGSTASIDQQSNNNIASITQRGNGTHQATLIQQTVDGNRFILEQDGVQNKLTYTQKGVFGGPTDVEIRQEGMNNTINDQTTNATVIRYCQTGNNNTISL